MDASSFEFTMSLPGDARLIGAVRELTSHAAGYAGLGKAQAESLVADVTAATEAAITASQAQDAPIQFAFSRDGGNLRVTIIAEAADGSATTRTIESA